MVHMTRNNILSSLQHGFVHGRSCTTQLLEVLDKWMEAIEQGDSVDAIYLDFAKAFDTVPHQSLLVKLAGYGIGGKVLQWIAAFLEGRRQRVLVNGSKSSRSPVTSGIPQRSVLGPMLFVCYINDMPDVVDSPIYMFADDTKIFRQMTAQSDQVTLQKDLRQLEARTRKWQLRFNEEKCKVMYLGQYSHHYDYTITSGGKDTTLGETTNDRDLGVQIDRDLKFDEHVEMVANKANKMLGLIRRSFTFLDGPTMKKLYTSLVRPILEYGHVVWAPTLKRDQQMIDNVQRRTTKLVLELKNLEYDDRLRALKLPSLYYRRARGDMIETYKYLHGIYKVDRMPLELDNNTVTRGHSLKLKKERVTARQRKHYFRHRVVNRWKTLTEYVISAPSLNIFKSRLDRFWCGYSFE